MAWKRLLTYINGGQDRRAHPRLLSLAPLSNENCWDLLERHGLHMPSWYTYILTYEVREPPVLEDHIA